MFFLGSLWDIRLELKENISINIRKNKKPSGILNQDDFLHFTVPSSIRPYSQKLRKMVLDLYPKGKYEIFSN